MGIVHRQQKHSEMSENFMKLDFKSNLTMSQKRTTTMVTNALFGLLCKKNFDDITVREICAISMIPHSTFYHYFEDKYDVISWAIHRKFYELYPEMDQVLNHYDNIEKCADLFYDFMSNYKSVLSKVAAKNPINGSFHQTIRQAIYDCGLILAANCTRDKDFGVPYEVIFNNYINGFVEVLNQTFYFKNTYSREQIHNYMKELYAK